MSTRSVRYSTFNRSIRKGNLASTDRDALAFLEAAQIYNANQQRAIVNLARSLKRVGLWSKMKAIYPFVGGTASSHKWNLKDPRDADAAFRLTFTGGWTHSSTGALPNGTNGYADTLLTPSTSLTTNSNHVSYYSGTNNNETSSDPVNMGSYDTSTSSLIVLYNTTAGAFVGRANGETIRFDGDNNKGHFIVSRQSSTVTDIYRNGIEKQTGNSGGTLPKWKIFIGNTTLGANTPYSNGYVFNDFRFATIGDGLTDSDATNLYNIVDLYQKRLGRAV